MATFASALALKKRLARSLLKQSKVYGVGIGYRDPKAPSKGAAVVIYADTLSAASLGMTHIVSTRINKKNVRVPIRLVKTGKLSSNASYNERIRPVIAGYSIGTRSGSGTLGLIVTNSPSANQRFMFSNNHVLTNPINSRTRAETLQPGGADNGRTGADRVGRLSRFVQLSRNGANFIDAALSTPVRRSIVNPRYATVGVIPGHVTSYRVGDRFKKVGRTTGLRFGTVESVNTDVRIDYGSQLGTLTFRNQTIIRGTNPISLPGDSGSVWLRSSDNYAAAVNFAGTIDGRLSVAFPVDWAMRRFQTRVAQPNGAGRIRNVRFSSRNRAYARRLTAKELSSIKVIRT